MVEAASVPYSLIIALDFDAEVHALALVDELDPKACAVKVGSEAFTRWGPAFIAALHQRQFKVFLDLKFHDIPNTVRQACLAAADLGVWMMNVHASGGLAMMQAAKEAVMSFGPHRPLIIAVTVLTSMNVQELYNIGIHANLKRHVCDLAHLAKEAELDGVVCSAWEAADIKKECGQHFLTVTPGIRLPADNADDQTRIVTPEKAYLAGSDLLVVGRSITKAPHPMQVIQDILALKKVSRG